MSWTYDRATRGVVARAEKRKEDALNELRKKFSAESLNELQTAYNDILEARAKTQRRLLMGKFALVGGGSIAMAYGLGHTMKFGAEQADAIAGPAESVDTGIPAIPEHLDKLPLSESQLVDLDATAGSIFEVHKGDNLWNILEERLKSDGVLTEDMTELQKNYILDSIEDKLRAMPEEELAKMGFTSGDIDLIHAGEKLDLSSVLEDKAVMDKILERAAHVAQAEPPAEAAVAPEGGVGSPPITETIDVGPGPGVNLDAAGDQISAEAVAERLQYKDPLHRLWELRYPGKPMPEILLQRAEEIRAGNLPIEKEMFFEYEVQHRMQKVSEHIMSLYGYDVANDAHQLPSHRIARQIAWEKWSAWVHSPVTVVRNSSGEVGGYLKTYLDNLAEEVGEPRPGETVEEFMAQGETNKLLHELGVETKAVPVPSVSVLPDASAEHIEPGFKRPNFDNDARTADVPVEQYGRPRPLPRHLRGFDGRGYYFTPEHHPRVSYLPDYAPAGAEGNPFIEQWAQEHPGRKMSAHMYEELQKLNHARDIIRPESLPRPDALWEIRSFRDFTPEYSSIKNATVGEFLKKIPVMDLDDPANRDTLRAVREGNSHMPNFKVGKHYVNLEITESYLKLRNYLNNLPMTDEVKNLSIEELHKVLEQR